MGQEGCIQGPHSSHLAAERCAAWGGGDKLPVGGAHGHNIRQWSEKEGQIGSNEEA